MKRLKSYDEFVNENLGAALGSPIKYTKIKMNAKKYQKAKVQQALNNLDFEKKKQASKGELDKKAMDTLKAANAAKNQALKDTASSVAQRMKDLATTDGLKKVVTLATTKSNLAAAQTALKAADAEETKQLKIKIKDLQQKAADAQSDLKDYESTEKDDKPQTNEPQQNLDDLGSKDGKGKKDKKTPETPETPETPANKDDGKDGGKDDGKDDKKKFGETDKADKVKAFDDQIKKLKDKITSAESKLNDDSIPANAKDGIKKNIDDMKAKVADFEKKKSDLGESYDTIMLEMKALEEQIDSLIEGMSVYRVDESISDKFRRLMANV